jgi:hypothetical protein
VFEIDVSVEPGKVVAFEIAFMTLDGQTAAVATGEASSVRPITS